MVGNTCHQGVGILVKYPREYSAVLCPSTCASPCSDFYAAQVDRHLPKRNIPTKKRFTKTTQRQRCSCTSARLSRVRSTTSELHKQSCTTIVSVVSVQSRHSRFWFSVFKLKLIHQLNLTFQYRFQFHFPTFSISSFHPLSLSLSHVKRNRDKLG